MLKACGCESLDQLMEETIPATLRARYKAPAMDTPLGETDVLAKLQEYMTQNKVFRSYIGTGYYNTHVPKVLLRNMLENPNWYTPYTPYQAEISQGRMEMLMNYQTMICDLTGMPIANAGLLDEATAAAEAMYMCYNLGNQKKKTFIVAPQVHPQVLGVVKTRANHIGVKVVVADPASKLSKDVCGVLVQYPDTYGCVTDFEELAKQVKAVGANLAVAADPLALTILRPPGEFGADICFGTTQRFGTPMGCGGPHVAFFACKEEHMRKMPGRIMGMTRDTRGESVYRMALQTREQHIRREKATSNICTAQALLANVNVAFAIYHGPKGLKNIALRVHGQATALKQALQQAPYTGKLTVKHEEIFDTVAVNVPGKAKAIMEAANAREMNFRVIDNDNLCVAIDETTTLDDVDDILEAFSAGLGVDAPKPGLAASLAPADPQPPLARSSPILTHQVFNIYHSENDMMRYLSSLTAKDLSLAQAMIPLGSCTMKANCATVMTPITWATIGNLHPFVPAEQRLGMTKMFQDLESDLAKITGFTAVSLQPNSGAQGELAGLLTIRAYQKAKGESARNVCLLPRSAHGTNPASAVLAGLKTVIVACDAKGNIDLKDLKAKAQQHSKNLACIMVTYPSTHGVYEEGILELTETVHKHGGQVYMDGANMNAQVGFCSPAALGADVCHLNLHKTFAIPHGGGGPGMGPIACKSHLAPYLPGHPVVKTGGAMAAGPVAAAPFGSASILPISWSYIKALGFDGLKYVTAMAILNANYLVARLKSDYKILYLGNKGRCAHEFIIDLNMFHKVSSEDVAKRLMDFGIHAPTMSFPVPGSLMVEPTESESKEELDRFVDAMLHIRGEIRDCEENGVTDSPLKNSPHPIDVIARGEWKHKYTREQAVYPAPYLRYRKQWPTITRVDNEYGDTNLVVRL